MLELALNRRLTTYGRLDHGDSRNFSVRTEQRPGTPFQVTRDFPVLQVSRSEETRYT